MGYFISVLCRQWTINLWLVNLFLPSTGLDDCQCINYQILPFDDRYYVPRVPRPKMVKINFKFGFLPFIKDFTKNRLPPWRDLILPLLQKILIYWEVFSLRCRILNHLLLVYVQRHRIIIIFCWTFKFLQINKSGKFIM